ncbi:MAG: efflux RND transporter periplasmic adaptor subunit [Gammaproteobacteria bacterium]|nr:efflux RND transporter periplasmic adaptor subunit [Gammaproteobacteria bacterium]
MLRSGFANLFIMGLALMMLWSSSVLAEKKRWGRASPVVVTEAIEQFLSPTIQVPGTIVSRQQSDLPAEVSGKLVWVAGVGSKLKWGEPVAKLDDTLYRLKASENKATLTRETTRLKYLNKELTRLEELIRGDFSSKNALDKVLLDRDVGMSEINVAKARVKVDEETLARYLVRTPFDGIVVKRIKKEGEWIDSGSTLVTFSNPDRLEIEARVSEETILHLNVGHKVRVLADGRSSAGTVRAIVGVGDGNSHLYEIRIDLTAGQWLAGKTVRVDVPIGRSRKVLSVPRDALVLRRSGVSLYRVNAESKSEKINVSTGITGGDYIEIIGDIKPGDKIVTRGNERLRAGQAVKITNDDKPKSHTDSNAKPSTKPDVTSSIGSLSEKAS